MPVQKILDVVNAISQSPPAQFYQKYDRDRASLHATVIAYNAILSMFPIMLALLAIVGVFVQDEKTLQAVNEAILRVLPGDVESDALKVVEASRTGSELFGLIGFLGSLWGGSALFGAMAEAFNRAYGVKDRDFIIQKLMAFGMIFVFAFLMLFSLVASSLATLLLSLSQLALPFTLPGWEWLNAGTGLLISLALSFLLFLIIYWIVPNRRSSFADLWPGALAGAFGFFAIVQIWPIYLTFIGRFNRFGALFGLFFLIMTWFYFLAQIVVIGAELNAFFLERRRREDETY